MDDSKKAIEGVEQTAEESTDIPILNEDERRVLEMYDRLEELQLEVALLRAQGVLSQECGHQASNEHITAARQELLEAKAAFQLRNSIIENVLIAHPIIKAVHAGSNASIAEQDLLPFIEQRDELSINLTQLFKRVSTAQDALRQVQTEHITTCAASAEMAASMVALAEEATSQRKEDISDSNARRRLNEIEKQVQVSKRKWRIMKGTASATVVGSGVDWARDSKLLEIVLDDEGD